MTNVMIVTGGSRGIGAATARLAAQRGYAVCVNYQSSKNAADRLVTELQANGAKGIAVQADVASEEAVAELFRRVDEELGTVTALVNNAGLTGRINRLDEVPAETVRKVIDINVLGTVWCSREAVTRMSTRHGGKGGAIVNLSSAAVTIGSPGQFVWYATSKGAIDSFTLGLGREVAAEGIRVNAVAPGLIDTEIHATAGEPDRIRELGPTVPIGRAGDAAEVAETILWLLSDQASYVTSTVLRVGGGR